MSINIKAEKIGKHILRARNAKGWTQKQLGTACDLTDSQISALENGKRMPGLPTLANLAVALDVSLDELYFGQPSERMITTARNKEETIVNCFEAIYLSMKLIIQEEYPDGTGMFRIVPRQYIAPLRRLFSVLLDGKTRKDLYLDYAEHLKMEKQAIVAEMKKETDEEKQLQLDSDDDLPF